MEDSILTISYDLFEEENTLNILAIALENIPTDELVLGNEISITEFVDAEELFEEIEMSEETEFIGWLINDELLNIENIIIQENLNNVLTKIYENIKKEKEFNLEHLEDVLEEDLEEIETLLIPVFRLIEKEELNLEGYVLGAYLNIIFQMSL